jgi:peptidoglycan/LPS O-acetylase OafA/YrhL
MGGVTGATSYKFPFGRYGVDLFLVLSGVVLSLFSKPTSPVQFLRRRFWRIAPAYWIAYTAYLIAGSVLLKETFPSDNILIHYAGLQTFFGPMGFDVAGSFWFITLLVYLYPLYAYTARWHSRIDLMVGIGCVATVVAGQWFSTVILDERDLAHFALRVPSFFFGIIGGQFLKNGFMTYKLEWWHAVVLGFVALKWDEFELHADGVLCAAAIASFYLMAIRPALMYLRLGAVPRILAFLGAFSLEIFLLHQPLLTPYTRLALSSWCGVNAPTAVQLWCGMLGALIVGLILAVLLRNVLLTLMRRPLAALRED